MPRHDVFISYAHLDNEPEYDDQQGWISIFQAAFRKRLSRELGRAANVFWDQRELRGNRIFDQTIREAFDQAGLMLAIVSPRYVQSESCRDELDYFSSAGATARGDDYSRLVIVEKTPVADALQGAHPRLVSTMTDTLGYRFYDHDERGVRREFQIYDATLRPRFDRKLDELVQDVAKFLRRGQSGRPPSVGAPMSGGVDNTRQRVFLAATSSDTRHLRDALQLELTDQGIDVVAPTAWSEDCDGVQSQLNSAIEQVSLSVHIVGSAYGSLPEGSDRALPELQFDLVQATSGRDAANPLICLVWLCPSAEPKSERQRAFIEKLRSYEGWREQDELLTGSLEELTERVVAKRAALAAEQLARERARQTRPAPPPGQVARISSRPPSSSVRKVYVISDPEDHARAEAIEQALQAECVEVLSASEITLDATTEQEHEEQHQEYLEKSDAFLIYHGNSKFRWVRAQADEARKALGRRGRPGLAGAVYVAQPMEGRKATYELLGIARCSESEAEPGRNLRDFIAALNVVNQADESLE